VLVLRSIAVGLRRTLGSPGMVLGFWITGLVVALPAAAVMGVALERSIGSSQAHERLRAGFDMGWYGEFSADARGIETTFRPTLAGVTAFLDNAEGLLDGGLFRGFAGLIGVAVLYGLVRLLLLGGALRRFAAPDRKRGMARFLQDGAELFPRFLRLALLAAPCYALVYLLHHRLYQAVESATANVTDEVTVLMPSLAVWLLSGLLLIVVHQVFAYARIVTAIEGRRSMLLASLRGAGFVLGHPLRTTGLHLLAVLAIVVLLAGWALLGPGTAQAGYFGVAMALLAGQFYLILRTGLRLAALGARTELYLRLTAGGRKAARAATPAAAG